MDSSVFEYFDIFSLVLARMGGLVFINPVFFTQRSSAHGTHRLVLDPSVS